MLIKEKQVLGNMINKNMYNYMLHFTNGSALKVGSPRKLSFKEASALYTKKGLILQKLEVL